MFWMVELSIYLDLKSLKICQVIIWQQEKGLKMLKSNYMKLNLLIWFSVFFGSVMAQKNDLKIWLDEEKGTYFQFTFLNQTWLRFNEHNAGTKLNGSPEKNGFDIGLRRTRMQMFGKITPRAFMYFQFGQNNFNALYNNNGNRKIAPFFHDALCEYNVLKENQLKIGGGLTIANGLSRFSQPSIGTIMTMDVPVFAQATVEKIDQFSRKLSVYARGQVSKLDYRFVLSDPFPVTTTGGNPEPISMNTSFSPLKRNKQFQTYLSWQFFEKEGHNTPYMTGTYLGKKKVFNVALGMIYQKDAMWRTDQISDTLYDDLKLICVESFLDIPVNKVKNTAVMAYAGYFKTDYGKNYLRYNGLMNPADGNSAQNTLTSVGPVYGNALPMFGTGNVFYTQLGYLLRKDLLGNQLGTIQPYVSMTLSDFDRFEGQMADTYNVGLNWLLNDHNAKISFDFQSRPTFYLENLKVEKGGRKSCFIVQFQTSI
jgi:hypothetical protein